MANNADFHIKQGNTAPAIEAQLLDNNDEPVDLDNYGPDAVSATVKFQMKKVGSDDVAVDAMAKVKDSANGIVEYEWQDGDTDVTGSYRAEFDVDADGNTTVDNFTTDETFPNNDYLLIRIEEGL